MFQNQDLILTITLANCQRIFIFIAFACKKGDVIITSEIRVNTIFPSTLDTREGTTQLAQLIREQLADNTRVDVDFKDIIFMSRSFADQFHKDIMAGDSVDIVIKNADLGIIEMLKAVSQTQNKRKPVKKSYRVLSFNNLDMLSDYSFAW